MPYPITYDSNSSPSNEALKGANQLLLQIDKAAQQGFYKAVKFIKTIKAILSEKEEDINFDFLSKVMVSLERIVLSLIKSLKSTKSFPLERYLEKIIAIKNHIDCLAKYAHSPRLRHHFFHKEFMVETFGQPARNVVMSKPSDWGSIISYALQFEQDASSPELDDMYAALRSNRKYRGTIRTPVHCECAVIVHFHNRHESKVLPVEYIGVSKLSCKGCALFLKPSMRLLAPDSAHETHIRNGTSHGICLNVIQDLSTNLGVIWSDTSRAQPTPLGSSFAEEAD
uniref:Uncharacterized protein n=1 Tax=Pyronema omphalodes (strain CBS 100304) TaxID=1076935 RepID=U4KU47_PYROM